jgi:predicted Zn-dependent protease
MARAGYDPRESVTFWKRMMAAGQCAKPPELMSTHRADQTRINQLGS